MFKTVLGHSEDVDSKDAILEIINKCNEELLGVIPQAGILLCAVDFEYDIILEEINKAYPKIELIGCTTDGEISSTNGFLEDSIVLTLFYSDNIEIKAGIGKNINTNSSLAAHDATTEAKSKLTKDAKFCLTTPESLNSNAVEVIKNLKNELGEFFPIFGGLAADQWQMKKTYQFYKNEVLTNSLPILIFGGNIHFSFGVENGWNPIGSKKTVTKVKQNIIFELDDEPILDFYNHYLGRYSKISSEYAIAVFPDNSDSFYLRSPAVSNKEDKSITFFGDIPNGSVVQLSESTSNGILNATKNAVKIAMENYPNSEPPQTAIIFSCATRKVLLGINTEKELEIAKGILPDTCSISGFYTYGEIAPLSINTEIRFHNSTFLIILIGE